MIFTQNIFKVTRQKKNEKLSFEEIEVYDSISSKCQKTKIKRRKINTLLYDRQSKALFLIVCTILIHTHTHTRARTH